MSRLYSSVLFVVVVSCLTSFAGMSVVSAASGADHSRRWSPNERAMLRSLTLSSLAPLAPDPSNRVADNPRAATLGHALFFDTRLSGNGKVSCATCHVPTADFQDGTPLARGVGMTTRRTMPIAGSAHSPWQFWDGRADSQWAQALGPLENPAEHGSSRMQLAHVIAAHYRGEYESVFGRLPDLSAAAPRQIAHVYANIGKAIAAYERRIEPGQSRFDR